MELAGLVTGPGNYIKKAEIRAERQLSPTHPAVVLLSLGFLFQSFLL